ncbi:MAG: sensor histidine kinase [Bacteroidia bacterium]
MEKKELIFIPESLPESVKTIVMEEFGTEHYFHFHTPTLDLDTRLLESAFLVFIQNLKQFDALKAEISKGCVFIFYGDEIKESETNVLAKDYRIFHVNIEQDNLLRQILKLIASKHQTEISVIDGFESIRNNEEKFRSFVRNISDIITLVDEKGNILYQSTSMMQKMGYGENELKGKSIFEIIHPDDILTVSTNFKEALENQSNGKITELRLRDKNGDYLYLEANGNNQFNNPLIGAFIINSRDITQRKIAEKEKNLLIEELTKKNKELRQFSFITTHNMRAPLTNIMAIFEIIKNDGIEILNEQEVLNGLENSVKNLDDTLNDLIKILIIRDQTPIEKSNLYFNEILNRVKTLLANQINDSKTQIEFNFNEVSHIEFIDSYLESIFINLIKNSIHFKHPDRNPIIKIESYLKNEQVFLKFTDNGIGIDLQRVKERVFGLYQRFHTTSKKGFGLYLVASQVQSQGGTISIEKSDDSGTEFLISFKPQLYV